MEMIYYMSDSCGCCKDYEKVVDRLSTSLKITSQKRNIRDGVEHMIRGVPAIIIEDNGKVIYENVGNLGYDLIMEDIMRKINGKGVAC